MVITRPLRRCWAQAVKRTGTRLLAYCLLPNHWHLVVWPQEDGVSRFVGWLTLTHTQRWHAHRRSTGSGHVYQGRFWSFPIQEDEHIYAVRLTWNGTRCERTWYVEPSSGDGGARPSAAWLRSGQGAAFRLALCRKANWADYVNWLETETELAAVRRSVDRGSPFGDEPWSKRAVRRLGLESTIRGEMLKKTSIGTRCLCKTESAAASLARRANVRRQPTGASCHRNRTSLRSAPCGPRSETTRRTDRPPTIAARVAAIVPGSRSAAEIACIAEKKYGLSRSVSRPLAVPQMRRTAAGEQCR